MAGYIGKEIQLNENRTLARITGLDTGEDDNFVILKTLFH